METSTPSRVPNQERLAATLACFLFFIPLLMGVKTAFVVKYMKQGFGLNVVEILMSILSSIIWTMAGLFGLINFIFFIVSVFLAFQAYAGKDHVIAVLYENAEKLIQVLNISQIFTPTK